MKTTTAAKATKTKPLTITFTGELADEIRQTAKRIGMMPATLAAIVARRGLLDTSPTAEGDEHRLETAARFIGLSLEATAELHRLAVEREAAHFAERRAERAATAKPPRRKAA